MCYPQPPKNILWKGKRILKFIFNLRDSHPSLWVSGFATAPVVSKEWPTQTGCYCIRQVRLISLISHLRFYFLLGCTGYLICLWHAVGKLTVATTAPPSVLLSWYPVGSSGGSSCRLCASSINIKLTKVPSYWQMCPNYTFFTGNARIILMSFPWSFFF